MDAASLVKLLNVTALAIVMMTIGLTVTFAQVLAAAQRLRAVLLACLANFVLVPLATVALLLAFEAPPLVAAGFLILAVCPGAPVAPTFTSLARGDVPLATGLMAILAALSAVLAPVLLTVSLAWLAPASDLHIDFLAVVKTLLFSQMLPLLIGLAVHQWAPRWGERLARPCGLVGNLLLLAAVALIVATQYPLLGAIRLRGWAGMFALLAASLGIGWICGGPEQTGRRALAVTTGVRNAAVGLVIVAANFADTPAVTAVVAYALVSIFGTLAFALAIGKRSAAP